MRALFVLLMALTVIASSASAEVLDDFDSVTGWSAVAARGARVSVSPARVRRGSALRIDFDFTQGGGEVIIHKRIPVSLPENYAIVLKLRGTAPLSPLELRLVDASETNVWRFADPEYRVPGSWRTLRVKQRRFEFGWGPAGGGKPKDLGFMEFVIARGAGGRGTLWIDDLRLAPLPPDRPYTGPPLVTASSALPERPAERVLEEPPGVGWHGAAGRHPEWLLLDFREPREYGGLVIDWDAEDYATDYLVERSDDGKTWLGIYTVGHGNGQRDYLPLPETESRFLRLRLNGSPNGKGYGIRHLEVAPLGFSASANRLFERMAHDAARGLYPRYFLGEQPYWTVVGHPGSELAGAAREGLLSLDGQLEPDAGTYSIEPFLYTDGRLLSWADMTATPSLARGDLPIPSVRLAHGDLALTVTALADERATDPLLARYHLQNNGTRPVDASLFLVVRPFLVNPPWQSLHTAGGASSIHRLGFWKDTVWIDEHAAILPLTPPHQVGVTGFDGYPITADLARDRVPPAKSVADARGWASGALRYAYVLPPGASREVILALPAKRAGAGGWKSPRGADASRMWAKRYAATIRLWAGQLDRVKFQAPPTEEVLVKAARSTLAHILIHRDGPALRPGSRRYGRTWIRDGAITSSALLAFGHALEVREFLRWYAGFQGPDGAIPCCVDPWGPDSMIEHDSVGAFVFTAANYYRHTHDRGFLAALWPRVARSVDYLVELRGQRLGSAYTQGDSRRFFGLLPESASHEGYVAQPMHSYWDDFWALRGLDDAAWLAGRMGDPRRANRYAEIRDAMRGDVERSIILTQERFKIDYVPGCAELGDLDPTSTAIAPSLGMGASPSLMPSLRRTFDRHVAELQARIEGKSNWRAYSPYEFRNVSALVRLGERNAAFASLRSLFEGRRPPEWNQWPEVVWRNPGAANFIGDLPHTWVGAEFIQAFLSLFVYEISKDRLMLAAGLPRIWVETAGGTGVEGLRTPFGRLSFHLEAPNAGETRMRIEGGLQVPAEGIAVDPPLPQAAREIVVNGRPTALTGGLLVVRELPARIVFRH